MTETTFDPNKQAAWASMQVQQLQEIERRTLQAVFNDGNNFASLYAKGLREHHFTTDATRFIFAVAESIFKSRGFVDRASITAEISEKKAFAKAGGEVFYQSLYGLDYDHRALGDYVSRMMEARLVSEFENSIRDFRIEMTEATGLSVRERLQKIREFQHEMMFWGSESDTTMYDADRVAQVVQDVLQDAIDGKQIARQRTGIKSLDEITGGLPESRVTIFAARTSHGKTSFAMWLSEQQNIYWRSQNEPGQVLYFSGEMSAQAMGIRYLSSMSGGECIPP